VLAVVAIGGLSTAAQAAPPAPVVRVAPSVHPSSAKPTKSAEKPNSITITGPGIDKMLTIRSDTDSKSYDNLTNDLGFMATAAPNSLVAPKPPLGPGYRVVTYSHGVKSGTYDVYPNCAGGARASRPGPGSTTYWYFVPLSIAADLEAAGVPIGQGMVVPTPSGQSAALKNNDETIPQLLGKFRIVLGAAVGLAAVVLVALAGAARMSRRLERRHIAPAALTRLDRMATVAHGPPPPAPPGRRGQGRVPTQRAGVRPVVPTRPAPAGYPSGAYPAVTRPSGAYPVVAQPTGGPVPGMPVPGVPGRSGTSEPRLPYAPAVASAPVPPPVPPRHPGFSVPSLYPGAIDPQEALRRAAERVAGPRPQDPRNLTGVAGVAASEPTRERNIPEVAPSDATQPRNFTEVAALDATQPRNFTEVAASEATQASDFTEVAHSDATQAHHFTEVALSVADQARGFTEVAESTVLIDPVPTEEPENTEPQPPAADEPTATTPIPVAPTEPSTDWTVAFEPPTEVSDVAFDIPLDIEPASSELTDSEPADFEPTDSIPAAEPVEPEPSTSQPTDPGSGGAQRSGSKRSTPRQAPQKRAAGKRGGEPKAAKPAAETVRTPEEPAAADGSVPSGAPSADVE
jgi:hypothetical protein